MFPNLSAKLKLYLTALGDQSILNHRTAELFQKERELLTREAMLGKGSAADISSLSQQEKLEVLRSLLIRKVAEGEYAGDAIAAIQLLEKKPIHVHYSCDIPIASEIGDIIKSAFGLLCISPVIFLTILLVNPGICSQGNQSQFCKGAESTSKFFYNYKDVK